jgi:uncharacterized protein with GYD domain
MSTFMLQASYSTAALAALTKKPQDRTEVIRKSIEKLGGTLTGLWLSFGDYDTVAVFEMPDNASAAAFALAIGAGGACSKVKTTPLLSAAEGVSALKKSGSSGYKAVSK